MSITTIVVYEYFVWMSLFLENLVISFLAQSIWKSLSRLSYLIYHGALTMLRNIILEFLQFLTVDFLWSPIIGCHRYIVLDAGPKMMIWVWLPNWLRLFLNRHIISLLVLNFRFRYLILFVSSAYCVCIVTLDNPEGKIFKSGGGW